MDDNGHQQSAAAVRDDRPGEVEFTGRRGPLLGLLLKNAFFNLITLSIYRFWAKTWIRRYFWNNIRIGGDSLEYTGLPSELFIGFLIVLAVLVPLGVVYEAGRTLLGATSVEAQGAVDTIYTLILLVLIQVAFYRMWRYRLTRTTWRGIRFGLDGSTWRYLWLSVGWGLLTILTLGIGYPWMRVALMRYRTRHSRFGATHFNFEGSGIKLLVPWLIAFLMPFAVIIVFLAMNPEVFEAAARSAAEGSGQSVPADKVRAPWLMLSWLAMPVLFIWYRVREFRYMVNCTRFATVSFRSEVWTPGIIFLAVLTTVLSLGLAAVVFGGAFLLAGRTPAAIVGYGLVAFLVYASVAPVLTYIILRYEIVRHVCRTLRIGDLAAFNQVVQSTREVPSTGEGLADAFDVGAI